MRFVKGILFVLLLLIFPVALSSQEGHGAPEAEEEFNASSFILEHIADSHEWHIITKKNGESVAIYLPVILYSREKGLDLFSSRKLAHGHEYNGYRLEEEGEYKGKIVSIKEDGTINAEKLPLDFSVTKNIVGMIGAAIIGLWFVSIPRTFL